MKKHHRVSAFAASLAEDGDPPLDPRYLGYFKCFNAAQYYEAHDVLENLWLESRDIPEANFYKGLIQLAGAFVHLKKHHERVFPPKDLRRLAPASRLFALARENLRPFSPHHETPQRGRRAPPVRALARRDRTRGIPAEPVVAAPFAAPMGGMMP